MQYHLCFYTRNNPLAIQDGQGFGRYQRYQVAWAVPRAPQLVEAWLANIFGVVIVYPFHPRNVSTPATPPEGTFPSVKFQVYTESNTIVDVSGFIAGSISAPWSVTIDWSAFAAGSSHTLWAVIDWPGQPVGHVGPLGVFVMVEGTNTLATPKRLWNVPQKYHSANHIIETSWEPAPIDWPGTEATHVHRPLLGTRSFPNFNTKVDASLATRYAWTHQHGFPLHFVADSGLTTADVTAGITAPKNRLSLATIQQYFDSDIDKQRVYFNDGCRQHAVITHVWDGEFLRSGSDLRCYLMSTQGRIVVVNMDKGWMKTIAGFVNVNEQPAPYWEAWDDPYKTTGISAASAQNRTNFFAKMRNAGTYVNGLGRMREPWGLTPHPAADYFNNAVANEIVVFVADTRNHCVLAIRTTWDESNPDLWDPDVPATSTITVYCGSLAGVAGNVDGVGTAARFNEPWAIRRADFLGAGVLLVTDTRNGRLVKIVPDKATGLGTVTTLFTSAIAAPSDVTLRVGGATTELTAERERGRVTKIVGDTQASIDYCRATYDAEGAFGSCSVLRPQALAQSSVSSIWYMSAFQSFRVWKIDLAALTAKVAFDFDIKPDSTADIGTRVFNAITLQCDRTGSVGPVDSLATGAWQSDTGAWWDQVSDLKPTHVLRSTQQGILSRDINVTLKNIGTERIIDNGPSVYLPNPSYPLGAVILHEQSTGKGGFFQIAAHVPWLVWHSKFQAGDRTLSLDEFKQLIRGRTVYRDPQIGRPSFELMFGPEFQNTVGPTAMDLIMRHARDAFGLDVNDVTLAAEIRAGWGNGQTYTISDQQMTDLIAYLKHSAAPALYGGIPLPPVQPPRNLAAAIVSSSGPTQRKGRVVWDPSDTVGVTSYEVKFRGVVEGTPAAPGSPFLFDIADALVDAGAIVQVKAITAASSSIYVSVALPVPALAPVPPSAPTSVTAVITTPGVTTLRKLRVTWTNSVSPNIANYKITFRGSVVGTPTASPFELDVSDALEDLAAATSIVAVNTTPLESVAVTRATPVGDIIPPAPPTNVSATLTVT